MKIKTIMIIIIMKIAMIIKITITSIILIIKTIMIMLYEICKGPTPLKKRMLNEHLCVLIACKQRGRPHPPPPLNTHTHTHKHTFLVIKKKCTVCEIMPLNKSEQIPIP